MLQVTFEKLLCQRRRAQCGVEVREAESARECMGGRARDQLRRVLHIALNLSVQVTEVRSPKGLMNFFGVVHDMPVVSSLERHHQLR